MKYIFALILIFAAVVGLGFLGVYYSLWPTSLNDKAIVLSDDKLSLLYEIELERKFDAAPDEFYFGAPNEAIRAEAELAVNAIISGAIKKLIINPQKSTILAHFKSTLASIDHFDSEEKDRALFYLERVLDIVDVNDSEELFNVWRYGFPYGWFIEA